MATVHGVVKAQSNKYDKYSILVDDNWYSSKYEIKASPGDEVEFDDMDKKYVRKLRVVKSGGGSPVRSAGGGTAAPGFPVGVSTKDRSIVRQNSLSHATVLVSAVMADSAKDDKAVTTWDERKEQMENLAVLTVGVARIFEDYSAGDSDAEEAKKMLES